jgi:hypothetical protein
MRLKVVAPLDEMYRRVSLAVAVMDRSREGKMFRSEAGPHERE